ncbi:aspartyl-phosphate phosphatase Spo0E family protein [Mesobacillus harenae]|uniref:aspartyl-phosphate phosphatase Spo0E family protein n=1 Tax=Mesobacillus harenae TaxID=2213203 RepID=UPI00157FE712|nr:aspartyl-phosphate phosphatase Spo0E family protein [Mesobacillus harenae]
MCQNKLLKDIENCRVEMNLLASRMPLQSKQVIEVSRKLDELINRYHRMLSEN